MKNGILTIIKKELARFFGDKRMIISILLPGILIYALYSLMGGALSNQFSSDVQPPTIAAVNIPASLKDTLYAASSAVIEYPDTAIQDAKQDVADNNIDVCIVFSENFDVLVDAYTPASSAFPPQVELYYNSASESSQQGYSMIVSLLDDYERSLANKFDVNAGSDTYDLISESEQTGSIFAGMMPMLLMMLLFSGCMAAGTESIAGEKERGTIATMLITPVSRNGIAFGKVIAVSIISLLSGISSALGLILSLPKLFALDSLNISGSFYVLSDYLMLGGVILSTVLVLVSLICILSALAKSVKEAQTMLMPLMIVVMFIAVTSMFSGTAKTDFYYYLIPLYNSIQCMIGVLSFHLTTSSILLCLVSNVVYAGIGAWILARLFHSERVIFSK